MREALAAGKSIGDFAVKPNRVAGAAEAAGKSGTNKATAKTTGSNATKRLSAKKSGNRADQSLTEAVKDGSGNGSSGP